MKRSVKRRNNRPGARDPEDSVSALLDCSYPQLEAYIRRQLWRDEAAGEVPPGFVDPRAVADEVARQALAAPNRRPRNVSHLVWFYQLARAEVRSRMKALREQGRRSYALDEPRVLAEDFAREDEYRDERAADVPGKEIQPPIVEGQNFVADPRELPPDEQVAHLDFIEYLQQEAARWPKTEREVFELHFLQGFESDEVARIEGLRKPEVARLVRTLHERFRRVMAAAARVSPNRVLRQRFNARAAAR
jgi:DNA-directed RNA polymerase specialized sigma24 family protein